MSNNLKRINLYRKVTVNGNVEFDYLDTNIHRLEMGQQRTFRISQFMEGRADLISYAVYGNVNYGWLIMWANDVVDPFVELVAGDELIIPPIKDYYNFYDQNAKRNR